MDCLFCCITVSKGYLAMRYDKEYEHPKHNQSHFLFALLIHFFPHCLIDFQQKRIDKWHWYFPNFCKRLSISKALHTYQYIYKNLWIQKLLGYIAYQFQETEVKEFARWFYCNRLRFECNGYKPFHNLDL